MRIFKNIPLSFYLSLPVLIIGVYFDNDPLAIIFLLLVGFGCLQILFRTLCVFIQGFKINSDEPIRISKLAVISLILSLAFFNRIILIFALLLGIISFIRIKINSSILIGFLINQVVNYMKALKE